MRISPKMLPMKRLYRWLAAASAALALSGCAVDPDAARAACMKKSGMKCSKAQCDAAGGTMRYLSDFAGKKHHHCAIPTHDAGKACHDSSECENECLARSGETRQRGTGMCGEDANADYKCSTTVRNGAISLGKPCIVD
jgi:hypothetical protein